MSPRPDFPIVDTHVHLWDPGVVEYGWLGEVPSLDHRFDLAALDRHRDGIEIEKAVFLECNVPAAALDDERRFVTGLADADPRLAGMVFQAPLQDGDAVRPLLESYAQDPRIKGVRRLLQEEEDPRYALRPGFVAGVRALAGTGLHFEICIYHHQMEAALELARQVPEVRFVLDHIGKPGIKDGLEDPWRQQIAEMAGLDNVWCKVSGIATEANHEHWTPEQIRPYTRHALECFPSDRVMFGGDWPVALLAVPYPRWVELLWEFTSDLTPEGRRRLFRDNAIEFYRLD